MRLDGMGLLVKDMGTMIRFYRDVLGFEIREDEDAKNVYLVKAMILRIIPIALVVQVVQERRVLRYLLFIAVRSSRSVISRRR